MAGKVRLDQLLHKRKLAPSRSKAAAMIMAGEVRVDQRLVDKPGAMVASHAEIDLKARPRFVSRGGLKLEAALTAFELDAAGKTCADVGASTGGFTDCLLQRGAAKVYAIDVGSGIIDYGLRQDPRVILLEKTNARYLDSLPECPGLVAIDVSFISLRLVLPAVRRWLEPGADVVALVKPQFEVGKGEVGKGGIVRDTALHKRVLEDIAAFAPCLDFAPQALIQSPITGAKGNIEYLLWLRCTTANPAMPVIQQQIEALFASAD